jgi:hypothetical protein
MNNLSDDDIKLFKAHQCLVDHLFEKSSPDGLCNLAFYRCLAKKVSERLLEKTHSHSDQQSSYRNITYDWTSRESFTLAAIKGDRERLLKLVHEHSQCSSGDLFQIYPVVDGACLAYTHLVLDHENDQDCDGILRGLRSLAGFQNIPPDGTCS